MPRVSGTYQLPSGQPVVAGTTISDTVFNTLTADLANELTNSIPRDGTAPPTANLPMGNYKITGLANGTVSTDAAAFGQVSVKADTTALANYLPLAGGTLTGAIETKRATVAAAATTTPLWTTANGNVQDWTSAPTITNFPAAPQAGSQRIVYPAAGTVITDNANINVQGNASYTVVAGDELTITAITTTTFYVTIQRKDGQAVITLSKATSSDVNARTSTALIVTPASLQGILVSATAQATTSGTSIDFTNIPSWAKRITVMLNGVSANGTSPYMVQIGSGSVQTTGYAGYVFVNTSIRLAYSVGFSAIASADTATTARGVLTLVHLGSNVWLVSGVVSDTSAAALMCSMSGGSVTLSGTLDRLRLTTVNGTDTFDAGSVNIMYE